MKQLYVCNFDIKNEFLDPKNPYVAIFRHQIALEVELQDYFQNSGAKSPSNGQKFKLVYLENHLWYSKKILLFFIPCDTL